ncbi:MAG: HEAT repeat domain-containing protein [Acidimicrobiales bacterium]
MVTPPSPDPSAPGRARDGAQTATELLRPDVTERRRAAGLAGHAGDGPGARAALGDDDATVRSTALGALDRLGVLTESDVRSALGDPSPHVRRRGCELAKDFPAVDISSALDDDDWSVVEMAAWALGERQDASAVPSLVELASLRSGHSEPLCREAAVAALGAIGDPAGLSAVLAALEDKPAVRRRAAVALAAFDDPAVEPALRRCLEDRDWQVRQVAEDLLAVE